MTKRILLLLAGFLLPAKASDMVTISSPSPLIQISVMVRGGSIHDPLGKEGLAHLTAQMLIQGGFGDPQNPVTKEKLALMTRPWGEGASPAVRVEKEVSTFYLTVPEDVLDRHLEKVLVPLFTRPLFLKDELERLRKETLERVSGSLRYEDIEDLGLHAIDHYIFEGTAYAHLPLGSVQGLKRISQADVLAFYSTYYRADNLIIGLSRDDAQLKAKISKALEPIGLGGKAHDLAPTRPGRPPDFQGRHLVIVALPNAGSTGIHAAFPLSVTRKDPDYWPLYVANIFFGTHRDGFSHLYQEIRQKRGYNYGDYSYIEHFADRPVFLFPPFNTPRRHPYFSIWIRPVAHPYVHHILKALTWELEDFIRRGLTDEEVERSKNKAKVLYLNLAETVSRLLGARLDDAYYGMREQGYLDQYLKKIEAVTPAQVNAALRRHLQARNIKYVVVTDDEVAPQLAAEIAANRKAEGKSLEDYRVATIEQEGQKVYAIPLDKLEMVRKDAVWSSYPLDIPRENIRIVPVEQVFETGDFIAVR